MPTSIYPPTTAIPPNFPAMPTADEEQPPDSLLALSVSPQTAFYVLESYFIVPKVYGKNLRVSTLTVLLGLLAGTLLAGVPGALAALLVIASYAAIERIWLKPFLRDGVSEKHELQKDQYFGEKE